MFLTKIVGKIKTRLLYPKQHVSENCTVYEIMWKKYGRAGQATDENVIRRIGFVWRITKATYKRSEHVILNSFSMATVVIGTRLVVTLHVRTLLVWFDLLALSSS